MMQVLVVDDQRMPRDNMEQILAASGRYEVAASISSAELAIIKCKQQPIDLILMDVCTKGSKNGIDAAAEIKQQFPNIKIIIVTSMVEVSYLERAKDAKADSFWYKDLSREELIDVIDRTMAGEHLFPGETPRVKLGLATSAEFTSKEIEVAEKLNVSVNTVKTHVSHILQRTGYANKTRLAIAVTNKNFIIPSIPEDQEEI